MPSARAKKLLEYEGPEKFRFCPIGVVRPRREGFCIIRTNGQVEAVEAKGYRHF